MLPGQRAGRLSVEAARNLCLAARDALRGVFRADRGGGNDLVVHIGVDRGLVDRRLLGRRRKFLGALVGQLQRDDPLRHAGIAAVIAGLGLHHVLALEEDVAVRVPERQHRGGAERFNGLVGVRDARDFQRDHIVADKIDVRLCQSLRVETGAHRFEDAVHALRQRFAGVLGIGAVCDDRAARQIQPEPDGAGLENTGPSPRNRRRRLRSKGRERCRESPV